jgi:hypothetical protein
MTEKETISDSQVKTGKIMPSAQPQVACDMNAVFMHFKLT